MSINISFGKILEDHQLVRDGDHILIAVSGGADSVALLCLFNDLKTARALTLSAFHLNHQFRGLDADSDQQFVEDLCKALDMPCFSFSENIAAYAATSGLSFETAARERRYALMHQVSQSEGCDKVALAHHLNDQVETFFQRLTRGSGMDGLTGMAWERDGKYIRPLLNVTRQSIEEYLMDRGQRYCTDKTNSDLQYMRNRVRHELIPYLEKHFNASVVQTIGHTMDLLKSDKAYLDGVTEAFIKNHLRVTDRQHALPIEPLIDLHPAIGRRVIRSVFLKVKGSLQGLESSHVDEIMTLVTNKRHGSYKRYQGYVFSIRYEALCIEQTMQIKPPKPYAYWLNMDEPLIVEEAGVRLTLRHYDKARQGRERAQNTYLIAADHLDLPLHVRNRLPGDRLKKKGLMGHKAVKEIFREQRIPEGEREMCPLLTSGDEIVWVSYGILAEPHYVTDATERICILTVEKL